MSRLANYVEQIRIVRRLLSAGRTGIDLYGPEHAFKTYKSFNRVHPRLFIVGWKTLGVALFDLSVAKEKLFAGKRYSEFRLRRSKATKLGYVVRSFDPKSRLDDIYQVNVSSGMRQNRKMSASYFDKAHLSKYIEQPGAWIGVFDKTDALRAYCHLIFLGDCCATSRILGEMALGRDGVMFLLIAGVVDFARKYRDQHPALHWLMYDMYLGGHQGLRGFKRHLGFEPHWVKWRWRASPSP